jgi:hypothetical protein
MAAEQCVTPLLAAPHSSVQAAWRSILHVFLVEVEPHKVEWTTALAETPPDAVMGLLRSSYGEHHAFQSLASTHRLLVPPGEPALKRRKIASQTRTERMWLRGRLRTLCVFRRPTDGPNKHPITDMSCRAVSKIRSNSYLLDEVVQQQGEGS